MLEEVDTLWRTAPLRSEKPAPTDEVRAVMAVFDETLYTAIPHVYRRVDDALQGPAAGGRAPVVRPFVRVGFVGRRRSGRQPLRDGIRHTQGRCDRQRARAPGPRGDGEPDRPHADTGCRDHASEREPHRPVAAAEGGGRGCRDRDRQALPRRAAPPHPAARRPKARRNAGPRRGSRRTATPRTCSPTCASSRSRSRRPAHPARRTATFSS